MKKRKRTEEAASEHQTRKKSGGRSERAQGDKKECCFLDGERFKNFKTACEYYNFPGSHQVGSYGKKNKGICRTYSNATPGKDIVLDNGDLFLYRLKDAKVRKQFEINMARRRPVRVFRKINHAGVPGVVDLGEFQIQGFIPAKPGDQREKFGGTFVKFVKVIVMEDSENGQKLGVNVCRERSEVNR